MLKALWQKLFGNAAICANTLGGGGGKLDDAIGIISLFVSLASLMVFGLLDWGGESIDASSWRYSKSNWR